MSCLFTTYSYSSLQPLSLLHLPFLPTEKFGMRSLCARYRWKTKRQIWLGVKRNECQMRNWGSPVDVQWDRSQKTSQTATTLARKQPKPRWKLWHAVYWYPLCFIIYVTLTCFTALPPNWNRSTKCCGSKHVVSVSDQNSNTAAAVLSSPDSNSPTSYMFNATVVIHL